MRKQEEYSPMRPTEQRRPRVASELPSVQTDEGPTSSSLDTGRTCGLEPQRALVSVVVPCFNEEQVIQATYERLTAVLAACADIDFEFLFVDDGSRDRTLEILRALQETDIRVRVIALSRNFGHQIAVTAGLEHAAGDATVLIDADLQDPPEVIREMLAYWQRGVDVAYGVRAERAGETAFKLWTAKAFYRSINRLSDVAIPLDTGDFRLMDRKVVDALLSMPERDRFVRGMVAWVGFRQEPVYYKRAARHAGETKYPLRKMVRFALDGILSFSLAPLRLAGWLGFVTAGVAMLGIVYALVLRVLTHIWVPGWTLLFIACSFLGGMQLVSLGVLGEYVGRIYGEAKRRPLYLIRERLGFSSMVRMHRVHERKALA
jgi:polyisoprenyl-phosphate glycosyltransferase